METRKITCLLIILGAALAAQSQQYIGCRLDNGFAETALLRKNIVLPSDVFKRPEGKFVLEVNSIGYHEVYINDVRVGDRVMQPAVSQLDKHSLSVAYDVGRYLHKGRNEITLWIGQGWGRIYGMSALVRASLCVGTDTLLVTDNSWSVSSGPYSYTGSWNPLQFGGERYDAQHRPDWIPATEVCLDGMIVTPQEFEGNSVIDTLRPIAAIRQKEGGLLLDFGRVVTGWFQADFPKMSRGHEVTMEYLDDYDFIDADDRRTVKRSCLPNKNPYSETDIYVAGGRGRESFTNRFHLHAFRYVLIRGVSADSLPARALQISAVNPDEGATFQCSDPRLNAVHDMIKYTLSCLTFGGYMVDCPHLERMGYGGDGNSSTMTLQTIYDVRKTYCNWLSAWADAMDSNGSLPYVAPAYHTGGGPYWSGFIVKAPWRTYLNYGDRTLIDRHYGQMKRWLQYVAQYSPDGLLQPWPDEGRMWFLGDWLAPRGVDVGGESALFVSNCFVSECLSDMEQMARLMGREDEADEFFNRRSRLLVDIHRAFYHDSTHTYANGTTLDQTYALLAGIPPNEQIARLVRNRLLEDCYGKYNRHISVGLMGVPIFTEWAIRERQTDLMATILRQPDYPGYLFMLDNDATTTWESWDGDRSRVHNCYNGVGVWFYQALAGIRPDAEAPGYRHFFIDPQPCKGVTGIHATKPTPYGTIRVDINGSHLNLSVPEGTSATVFPNRQNQRIVGAGVWEFEIE